MYPTTLIRSSSFASLLPVHPIRSALLLAAVTLMHHSHLAAQNLHPAELRRQIDAGERTPQPPAATAPGAAAPHSAPTTTAGPAAKPTEPPASLPAVVRTPTPGYRLPASNIVRIVDAAPTPTVSLSPTRQHLLLLQRDALPPIADLAAPMLRLAGERINPSTNGPHGPRRLTGFTLQAIPSGPQRPIALPKDANLSAPLWSPDGQRFAFTRTLDSGIELWVGDVTSASAKPISAPRLSAITPGAFRWMPDSKSLLVRLVPEGRGPLPPRPVVPAGPVIQVADGRRAPLRTFQDMLKDEPDALLFEHLATAQLTLINADTGAATKLGAPAIFADSSVSPDGRFILVSRITRPFSYQTGWGRFPEIIEVWDAASAAVVREIARQPLRELIPIEGVETGPRDVEWRETAPATLVWAEALDGGNPRTKAPHRDRLLALDAPFTDQPREWYKTQHRFTGLSWLQSGDRAVISDYDRDRRWTRTVLLDLAKPDAVKTLVDRSVNDRYNDPGTPLTTLTPAGRSVVRVDANRLLMRGPGASPEGDRPFLDTLDLDTLKSTRIWQSTGNQYESVVDVLGPVEHAEITANKSARLLTSRESPSDPPNFFLVNFADGQRTAVTNFPDPTPELRSIKKQILTYQRKDGTPLSATLYLPPDYREGDKLPLILWAYPREVSDAATAGQVAGSPHRFVRFGGTSHLFLLLAGYAIMDEAAMPVVGDPETMNDTFVQQIIDNAQAAIDKAASLGVADPTRVGVAGHSYGAFMTANLLAHAPPGMFRAGVARSGAYNRTLTPFGFQAERRTYWEAPDIYNKLSPFTYADRIKTPCLLIHGEIDNNPGTFPMQSERLFQAIRGTGGTARLVMLPFESHGYIARESTLHTLAEMIDWFDTFVKPDQPIVRTSASEASSAR